MYLRFALFMSALSGLGWVAGCQPDLSICDESAARTVVFDGAGAPNYAGQALAVASCNLCHSEGVDRKGAPAHLNFNVRPACSSSPCKGDVAMQPFPSAITDALNEWIVGLSSADGMN